jgi:integrase/recombinase XerD
LKIAKQSGFRREPLTHREVDLLCDACQDAREKLTVYTLLDTGLRVQELTNLKRKDIEWQSDRIIIYGKGGSNGSMSKRRIVPLSPRVKALLEAHYTLYDTFGLSARSVQKMVKDIASRTEITRKVTPHVLRHTFAVRCLQKGISLASLQKLLGHSHLSTTAIYLNISPEEALAEYKAKWS